MDTAAERLRLRRELERLEDLYLEGDLDKAGYREHKAALMDDLASLPEGGDPDSDAGTSLAGFLADLATAWSAATPEEQNRIARQLFTEAVVENRTVVAVKPRPDLLPFFGTVNWCESGSDGGSVRHVQNPLAGPVRVQVPDFPPSPDLCAGGRVRARRDRPVSRRYAYRPGKLTDAQESAIRALGATRSLSSLAADFGVSHETVRTVLSRRETGA